MDINELIVQLQNLIDKECEPDSSMNVPINLKYAYDCGYSNGVSIIKWEIALLLREIQTCNKN